MSTVTIRPNDTPAFSSTVTGAATHHAALSDDSDSSYVNAAWATVTVLYLEDLTIPAGAVLRRIAPRVRADRASGTGSLLVSIRDAASNELINQFTSVTWATPTTVTTGSYESASLTDSQVDGLLFTLGQHASGVTVRVYEAYLDVTYVTQPVVSVDEPASTVEDTNRPTVTWSDTLDSDGDAQTFYEVKFYTDAQYGDGGFDPATSTPTDESGVTTGSDLSWQGDELLADDTYRAYVRVAQTVNGVQHWSAWDFIEFTLAVDLPGVPTMTLTADDANARIEVDVDDAAGAAATDYFEVQRSTDGGTTWVTIRSLRDYGLIVPTSGVAATFDYEAPEGVTISYRARAAHDYSGVLAYSAWTTTATATWSSTTAWLKHPSRPDLNMAVVVKEMAETQRPARQGVFQPLGATLPIIVSDTREGASGTVTFRTDTQASRAALDVLLDLPTTLLLQLPAADGEPDRYVVLGNHARARIGGLRSNSPFRLETVQWREVAAPADVVEEWPPGALLESDTVLDEDTLLDEIGVV